MDLKERKKRLKMFLEFESDKEMLTAFVKFAKIGEEFQLLSSKEKYETYKKYFHFLMDDNERFERLLHCTDLVTTFMEVGILEDNLTSEEAVKHADDVFNQLNLE